MIQIYVPLPIHPKRRHIFPLLKPFEKGEGYDDATRKQQYGISEKDLLFVHSIEACDYVVLPMSWNFYLSSNQIKEVDGVIAKAASLNKKVLSFMTGDFGVKIPEHDNLIVFRHSGERTKLSANHLGYPAFIQDPLRIHYRTEQINVRPYKSIPTVGFCGQANLSFFNALKENFKTMGRNIQSKLGFSHITTQQVVSTSYLRASVLRSLEKAEDVDTNFIYRKKYRAGATTAQQRQKTTLEFYDNLQESDYVVCVRGAGNFSIRFYEALAMGRIPVFIDTDCLLPLPHTIDWQQHIVWVPFEERARVAEKVLAFHHNLSSEQFCTLQLTNRQLWKEQMTLGGFFKACFKSNALK